MSNQFTIIEGDAIDRRTWYDIPEIDLIVTSPPYDDLRTYGGKTEAIDPGRLAFNLRTACRPGAVCCVILGERIIDGSRTATPAKWQLAFIDMGWSLHERIIWAKPNFSNPSSNRYHQTFEEVFVFSLGTPKTFNPLMDRPNKCAGKIGSFGRNTVTQADGTKKERPRKVVNLMGKRHNVWNGPTRGQEEPGKSLPHPAMMPRWLARDLIRSWSNEGDIVLDPFAGAGTTGEEAIKLKRKTIVIELNPAYIELIHQRLNAAQVGLPL